MTDRTPPSQEAVMSDPVKWAIRLADSLTFPELEKMTPREVDNILKAAGLDLDELLRRIRNRAAAQPKG